MSDTRKTDIRSRLEASLQGSTSMRPVYAVYDWFVKNRPEVSWEELFSQGLGQINHTPVIRHEHPNFQIDEKFSKQDGFTRRDVRIVTDHGELHEWYLDNWKQEYFIKSMEDYKIMLYALEDIAVFPDDSQFMASEKSLGNRGITLGTVNGLGNGRTPLMVLQIDWVGLEKWSYDLALEEKPMLDLLEMMDDIKLREFQCAVQSPAGHLKLWENLSIDTMGPTQYRKRLVPLYRKLLGILENAGERRLHVHYDGRLKIISDQIADLGIYGIDSFTEAPEGDMTILDARNAWPDKFLWIHPNLEWYFLENSKLSEKISRSAEDAGGSMFCLEISEDIPHEWERTVPLVLQTLDSLHR